MSDKNLTVRFPNLLTFLTAVFVTLKVTGVGAVSTWSWWWVLSPLWLPTAVLFAVVGVVAVAAVIKALLD